MAAQYIVVPLYVWFFSLFWDHNLIYYKEVLTGIDYSHIMKRLLWLSKDEMNDITLFVIKIVMSLFRVNLAIIIYSIQNIYMILYDDLIVIDCYFRKYKQWNDISLFGEVHILDQSTIQINHW